MKNINYTITCPEDKIDRALVFMRRYIKEKDEFICNINIPCGFLFMKNEKWFAGYEYNLGYFVEYLGIE